MSAAHCPTTRRALYLWLARGAIGLALLAIAMSTREALVAIPALLVALLAFRGCPMCWVFGLIERGAHNGVPRARKDAS